MSVVTTKRELFNLGLSKVTRKRIGSVDEGSDESNYCNEYFGPALRHVLFEHPWSACTTVTLLQEVAGDPPHGYTHNFQLPNTYIRLHQCFYNTRRDSFDFEWQKFADQIWTDQGTVYARYTYQPQNIEQMNPPLIMAVGQYLGYLLASPLSKDDGREQQLLDQYEKQILPRAKALDSMESRYLEFEESPWIEALLEPGTGGHDDFNTY